MKYIIIALSLICLISCSSRKKELREGKIELVGIAANLSDHSEKSNCFGIIVDGKDILFKGDFEPFKSGDLGKIIKVTGLLKKRNLPMFIWDDKKNPQGAMPQGMPMPPGTDIEKESLYYIIENPQWEIKK